MSLASRAVCRHRLLMVRTIAGSFYDYGNIKKVPGKLGMFILFICATFGRKLL